MIWIANGLVALVAALHVYFLVLEMFFWTKPLGLKTFRNTPEKAADSTVLAANQGLYNGFLAAGLIWGLVQSDPAMAFQIKVFFLLVRDRRRNLWRRHRQPPHSVRPGRARGDRAHSALAGVSPLGFLASVAGLPCRFPQ
jgi:putative membrane protein